MENMNIENEITLSNEPYNIDIPVKFHERVRISGYVRTTKDENKDGAIIIFDLGDYQIDENILKDHGLKQSKIGIYRYLPMGKAFEVWSVDIFIPVKIKSIKVSFKAWKNKEEIMIGTDLTISKDFSYSRLYKKLELCIKEKEEVSIS
ncbi:MAG TPA: hypothetical protein EYH42_00945 [Sulfurovum sp.]|nr:hypothetical protein [Sulfurovum sp.]